MTLSIRTNVTADFAFRNVQKNLSEATVSTKRIASGKRINVAADDVAGFGISERLKTQIRGLRRADLNVQDGISMIQLADGTMNKIGDLLQRIRTLAVQAVNDTNTSADRRTIQLEIQGTVSDIDLLVSTVTFNGQMLLDGSHGAANPFVFHIGANKDDTLNVSFGDMRTATLGIDSLSVATRSEAESAIATVDGAIDKVSENRSTLGAYQNRLEMVTGAVRIGAEDQSRSESRLRDTDFPQEITRNALATLKTQVGLSALSQASIGMANVIRLLG